MLSTFALELLRLFSRPEKHHQFPNVYYRYYPDDLTPAPFPTRLFGACSVALRTCSSTTIDHSLTSIS